MTTLLGKRHAEPDIGAVTGRDLCTFPSKVEGV